MVTDEVGVAATVCLQHCHSEDSKIRNEAAGEYRTAIEFLRRASNHYPALLTAVLPLLDPIGFMSSTYEVA